jgi:transposase
MHIEPRHTVEQLQRHARDESRASVALRIRLIVWALQGRTAGEIATLTDLSLRQVQAWVCRYNREGLAGLANRPGRGRKPPLTAAEQVRLKARLDAGPRPEDQVCTLRGKDVQRILAEEFGQLRRLAAVYHLLHKLGYSCLAPRPQHRQADPAAQEEFKKSFPNESRRFVSNIPIERSRSSFRMKRGLVSRAH